MNPFTSVSPGPDGIVSERSRALANCFDVARIIVNRTAGSTIREAALAGIPTALVEGGGEGRWSQDEADIQRRGLHRVAALAGILPAEESPGRTRQIPRPGSKARTTSSSRPGDAHRVGAKPVRSAEVSGQAFVADPGRLGFAPCAAHHAQQDTGGPAPMDQLT